MTDIAQVSNAQRHAWREEFRAMLSLGWPIILTNLAQSAMTATDVMMMGWLGPHALAAGALGSNLYFGPMIAGLGLMLATGPLLAAEIGRNRFAVHELRRTVRKGLWSAVVIAAVIWFILWRSDAILIAMGQDEALAQQAASYVRALMWGVLPFYWYTVLRCFVAALERPRWALIIVLVAVAFNALGNWCLVFGNLGFPALGIVGSGLATSLASIVMFGGLALVLVTERRFRRYHLFGRFWKMDLQRLGDLLRLGLPISGLLAFEVTVFNAAAFAMGLIGADSIAAYAIAIQVSSLTFMVPLGLGQAATVRVGIAFGARDRDAARRAGWTALAMGVGFMAVMALLMVSFPLKFIGAFITLDDPANRAVIGLATSFLAFAAMFQVVDGAQAVTGGMLRGLHDTRWPMILAAIGYWGIGLPLGIFLAFKIGLQGAGIWIGLSAGLAVVAAFLLIRWLRRERIWRLES
jgi:MATE family multidrug resistance protein